MIIYDDEAQTVKLSTPQVIAKWIKGDPGVDSITINVDRATIDFQLRKSGKANYQEIPVTFSAYKGEEEITITSIQVTEGNASGITYTKTGNTVIFKSAYNGEAPKGYVLVYVNINGKQYTKSITVTSSTRDNYIGAAKVWITGKEYTPGDIVYYTETVHVYRCIAAHTSTVTTLPTSETYWQDVTELGAYISWADDTILDKGQTYDWCCTASNLYSWQIFDSLAANLAAFDDIMTAIQDSTDDTVPAIRLIKKLAVCTAMIKDLIVEKVTVKDDGYIKSEVFDNTHGFKFTPDGKAVLREAEIGGYVQEDVYQNDMEEVNNRLNVSLKIKTHNYIDHSISSSRIWLNDQQYNAGGTGFTVFTFNKNTFEKIDQQHFATNEDNQTTGYTNCTAMADYILTIPEDVLIIIISEDKNTINQRLRILFNRIGGSGSTNTYDQSKVHFILVGMQNIGEQNGYERVGATSLEDLYFSTSLIKGIGIDNGNTFGSTIIKDGKIKTSMLNADVVTTDYLEGGDATFKGTVEAETGLFRGNVGCSSLNISNLKVGDVSLVGISAFDTATSSGISVTGGKIITIYGSGNITLTVSREAGGNRSYAQYDANYKVYKNGNTIKSYTEKQDGVSRTETFNISINCGDTLKIAFKTGPLLKSEGGGISLTIYTESENTILGVLSSTSIEDSYYI